MTFFIAAAAKKRGGMPWLSAVDSPTSMAWALSLQVLVLTYECWAIPFRLALMRRWHWLDFAMDAVAVMSVFHGVMCAYCADLDRAMAQNSSGVTFWCGPLAPASRGPHTVRSVPEPLYLYTLAAFSPLVSSHYHRVVLRFHRP